MTEYLDYIDLKKIFDGYEYNGDKDDDDFQDELHEILDEYICGEQQQFISDLVHTYGVFKAIKDYSCEYGDFDIDPDLSFVKTYGTLAYFIVNEYIRDNMSLITDYLKKNNMITVYKEDDEFFNKECGTLYKKSREAGMSICHVHQLMCDYERFYIHTDLSLGKKASSLATFDTWLKAVNNGEIDRTVNRS